VKADHPDRAEHEASDQAKRKTVAQEGAHHRHPVFFGVARQIVSRGKFARLLSRPQAERSVSKVAT
jgi:hypothetical protein